MNRLEKIREHVDKLLLHMRDDYERRCGYLHLYGVSQVCIMLATKRNLNPEIGGVIGMLHDIYVYRTGIRKYHSHNGAEEVRPFIRDMGIFTDEEQQIITSAIFHHSDKGHVHDPYDELLKDADVLQHFLYNTSFIVSNKDKERLNKLLREMEMTIKPSVHTVKVDTKEKHTLVDKRLLLADIAESLAGKNIVGEEENIDYQEIVRYWPVGEKENVFKIFQSSWCASFVYHCCMVAGILLPVRHPKVSLRFGAVHAWYDWANLPEIDFYIKDNEGFIPERGDIVIYENIIDDEINEKNGHSLDHIGIVLSSNENTYIVAEGNADNQNQSAIITRNLHHNVNGFIRIDNRYQYSGWKYDYKTGIIREELYNQPK